MARAEARTSKKMSSSKFIPCYEGFVNVDFVRIVSAAIGGGSKIEMDNGVGVVSNLSPVAIANLANGVDLFHDGGVDEIQTRMRHVNIHEAAWKSD
jgi:hypothetical protein